MKYSYSKILAVLAVFFFFVYSYLTISTPLIFNSPDATANYFFASRVAEGEKIAYPEPLNIIGKGIIHPRSVNIRDANLVPGGFLGLILIYGFIGKFLGVKIILFLTPFFSALAALFFFGLIKEVWQDEKIAFISACLLFIHPSFWYYSARGLLPNVLFVDLVIIGASLAIMAIKQPLRAYASFFNVLGAIIMAFALWVRPVEAFWLLPAILILFAFYYRDLLVEPAREKLFLSAKAKQVFLFGFILVLAILPMLFFNRYIYGGFFRTGYSALNTEAVQSASNGIGADTGFALFANSFFKKIFFQFHPRLILQNFYNYFIKIFWWLFLGVVLGVWMVASKAVRQFLIWRVNINRTQEQKNIRTIMHNASFIKYLLNEQKNILVYFVLLFFCSFVLVIYYGSWDIRDNITPGVVSIGNSYTRYWLPIYIISLPFIACAFISIINFFQNKLIKKIVFVLLFFCSFVLSFRAVTLGDEGVLAIKNHLQEYQQKKEIVLSLTEADSVIVSDRYDKVFFPQRRVITPIVSADNFAKLSDIIKVAPVYVYSFYLDKDLPFIQNKFKDYSLKLEYYKTINDNERLYRVIPPKADAL